MILILKDDIEGLGLHIPSINFKIIASNVGWENYSTITDNYFLKNKEYKGKLKEKYDQKFVKVTSETTKNVIFPLETIEKYFMSKREIHQKEFNKKMDIILR